MAPAKGEAKPGEGKGSPTKKRKMKSPSKAALPVEFDWSAELIEECMLRGDSGAHLAKYCGSNEQITGDGTAPVVKKWAAPKNVARRRKDGAAASSSRGLPAAPAPGDAATAASLGDAVGAWVAQTLPGKYVAAGEPAFLPLKCFLDGALEETVAKRFAALSDEAKMEHGAFALAYPPGADPSKIGEWRECVVAGGFRDDGDAYELTWTGGDRGTCARDCAAVVFKWQDLAEAVARLTRALRRRRECEALLKVRHHIRCMPVMDRVVVLPKREQWDRLLGVALSLKPFDGPDVKAHALRGVAEAHVFGTPWLGPEEDRVPVVEPELDELAEADLPRVRSILALVDEAVADYEAVMNEIVFVSDKLNVANYSAYLQLMLPAPPPRAPPPRLGVVATPPHDFPKITIDFRSATFLDSVEVVQALTDTQMHAIAIHDLKILATEHAAPQSPDEFTTAQTAAVAAALRTLKEQWVQRTAASIRQDLATADRSVYNLEEGAMASYSRPDNKLYLLLKRINYVMTHELFLVTFESLTNYTNYVVDACKGQVTVNSTSDVECVYPDRKADEPPRMPPLFFMTVIITPEKRVLNQPAVDARNAKIAEWHKSDEGKEEGAECPHAPIEPVEGRTFDYETPLSQMESCVASAFRHAIKELRAIPHVQRYIMERLFWPRPEMIGAVTGEKVADFNGVETYREDERWIGDLEESFVTAVRAAIDPARTYLDCFHQWEDFLNLEVDEYVAGLAHAQLNDEEVEEGEEPDAPPVKVNLVVLKATLNTHREEKARVEAMIPGRPLSAGLCMLNAAALRDELANKHMAIMQGVLATHADHCSQVAVFLDQRFSKIEAALKKKPRDIEETKELEEYLANVPNDIRPLQEFIDEMRLMAAVLDGFEYRVDFDHFEQQGRAAYWPCKIAQQSEETARIIESSRERYLEDMMTEQERFTKSLHALEAFANSFVQYEDLTQVKEAAARAVECMGKITAATEKARLYNSREVLFEREVTDYAHLTQIKKAFEPYYALWNTSQKWLESSKTWNDAAFQSLDAEAVESEVNDYSNAISKASKFFERNDMGPQASIAKEIKEQVSAFKPNVPIIVALRNKGMRERHWHEVGESLGMKEFVPDESFMLAGMLDLNPTSQIELITKVSEAAAKEFNIEQTLDKMLQDWTPMELQISNYRDTGTGVLKGVDEITAILDEHVTTTQAMQFSAFKGPFEERIESWNHKLYIISEVLDAWLNVQRNWMYLQPIFESPDINKQLPSEGRKFATVDKNWKQTISSAKSNPIVMDFCDNEKLLERLKDSGTLLDQVQKGLNDYLETKRGVFSRFYFLSNDDLLSILSESKDVMRVQPHFKKCFEAINAVEFQPDLSITKMISPEKEMVPMMDPIDPVGKNVEDWMLEVEAMMRTSIRHVMDQAIQDYPKCARTQWMQKWPSMCILNGSQMHWTSETEQFFEDKGAEGPALMLERQLEQLDAMVKLVRGDLPKAARAQVGALAVIDVHARDVMKRLANDGVSAKADFAWMSQLRYYWDDGDLWAEMVAARRKYGYEYLGNSFRLVITPLTDKCYLTLMGALQMILGGAPAGPAGTGKTETTKDLAKAVAMQCVVFNCSDGLDYQAMGKFFKGLASCGAWACFDEFNRINIEVLSVVGQQVMSIQLAIKGHVEKIEFEGSTIKVKDGFGVFITMNPGYAGRSALPDSLSALFRPVAMMVPDYALIGEIMFFAYGFAAAKDLGRKMVTTFKLCSEQCSSQPHYDYGMRAVKTVITAAGNLKRKEPESDEMILLLRALQDVNIPKFLAGDLPLFQGIISDLFPGKKRPVLDYGALFSVMKLTIEEQGLQPHGWFIGKIVELYEMIVVRHGLMLVGPTGGGKSANLHVLENTLGELKMRGEQGFAYEKVKIYQLNPKSITMGQMYGQFDENTREWQDGIMSTMYRRAASSTTSDRKWVMFDGPVDAIWIENMNTVLDDNKKLCLVSGESVKMSGEMTMMFEVEDLLVASPATVSRVGIIYMEPKALGLDVLVQSWIEATLRKSPSLAATPLKATLVRMFDTYLNSSIAFVRLYTKELLPTMDNNLAQSLMRLMDCFLEPFEEKEGRDKPKQEDVDVFVAQVEARFIFSLVWSVGCTGAATARRMYDAWLRAQLATNQVALKFPEAGDVYDYVWSPDDGGQWRKWMETIDQFKVDNKLSFSELIVPTADSVRSTYVLAQLLKKRYHVMLVGETGTGKTVTISQYLQGSSKCEGAPIAPEFTPLTMTFSAQTSANMTQDTLDGKFEKRRRGVFGPPAGKVMAIHVDDLNMPMRETYGAQPPIEILRQWFSQEGWYDRANDLAFRRIVDVVFVASLGPPGGGRQEVTPRFIRPFNVVGLSDISDNSKAGIFGTILGNFLEGFTPAISKLTSQIVLSTINTFNTICETLLPTPSKSHYTFNLRDLAKVFQGVLMGNAKMIDQVDGVVRLWVHELKRVFEDRLTTTQDHEWFMGHVESTVAKDFGIEWSKIMTNERLMYCDFLDPNADPRIYCEVTDIDQLKQIVNDQLEEHNGESKSPMPLVMFLDAIEHVLRIARILRQPQGNALLLGVGGSGRQSMSKMATYISGYQLFQVEIAKGYGLTEWRDDIRRCLLMAGVKDEATAFVFSDAQVVMETFLEDINNILNAGDVPNLYGPEEMDSIMSACRVDCQKKQIPPTKINIFAQYIIRVRRNMHICLCMSPLGETFRERLRQFPSLVNCSTIDWFTEWPAEALESVGMSALVEKGQVPADDRDQVVKMFKKIHQDVEHKSADFWEMLRRHNYVTPTSYLELLSSFATLLSYKREEVKTKKDRLQIGLDKLTSTKDLVAGMQEELVALQPQLVTKGKEVDEMMIVIDQDKKAADEVKAKVLVEEEKANGIAERASAIAADAQKDLDEALPALDAAVQCLKELKKAHIDEVKALRNPPGGVRLTMEVACLYFEVAAVKKADPNQPGKKIEDFFEPAQKVLLSDANRFLKMLQDYDKDHIPDKVIKKVSPYMSNPDFTVEQVEKASVACRAICMWAHAMHKYHFVALGVAPKKAKHAEATAELDSAMAVLNAAQSRLKEVVDKLDKLEQSLKAAVDEKQSLADKEIECKTRLSNADKLIGGLGGEQTRWAATVEHLSEALENCVGDVLVSAGTVSYLGPFTSEFRKDVVDGWQATLGELGIKASPGCDLVQTLVEPVKLRMWQMYGLPTDNLSTQNGIMLDRARRWSLFIDPQGQANRFLRTMAKDKEMCKNGFDVTKLSDKNFLRTLENAVRFGAAKESDIPHFKGSDLGRFPVVSADFWTSDHLSERSRSVDAFSGTRARGTLTLKRR